MRYQMHHVGYVDRLLPPLWHIQRRQVPAQLEVCVDAGGLTNVAIACLAAQQVNGVGGSWRVGTMVAANSGRPGGACSASSTGGRTLETEKLHAHHKTQEEDVVSNWLLTAAEDNPGADPMQVMDRLFARTVSRQWGMSHPERSDCDTLQNIDYRDAKPAKYADAWVVRGVWLSRKEVAPVRRFDFSTQYPTSLYFVSGPNAGAQGRDPRSSTRRTFNEEAAATYGIFREGVKAAVRAGLLAMAMDGCDVALLAGVATGLYAGDHRSTIRSEYAALVNEILAEPMQHEGISSAPHTLGECFARVVWTVLE